MVQPIMNDEKHHFGLITLECRDLVNHCLDKNQAAQLGEQIAKDLTQVLKLSNDSSLVIAAAVYATEAVLTPGFILHRNLLKYGSAAFQGEQQQHRVLSIGAHQGNMPEGLQTSRVQAPLVHIPFILSTDSEDVSHRFEANLLDKGMLPPPTYQLLCDTFQGQIVHANYMSHLDLVAMMHNHYDQVGMHHLWQVVESAILSQDPHLNLKEKRQAFYLRGQRVFIPFYTLPTFIEVFSQATEDDYPQWLLSQRLAYEVFQSHGLDISFFYTDSHAQSHHEKALKNNCIEQDFYHCQDTVEHCPEQPQLVDYMHPEAGYILTNLIQTDGTRHSFYPLTKAGQKAIDDKLSLDFIEVYQSADKQKRPFNTPYRS